MNEKSGKLHINGKIIMSVNSNTLKSTPIMQLGTFFLKNSGKSIIKKFFQVRDISYLRGTWK